MNNTQKNVAIIAAYTAISVLCCITVPLSAMAMDTTARQTQMTLSLQDCKSMAKEHNPYIKNAELSRYAAEAQKGEALAEYFPKVSISGFAFHALNPLIDIGIQDIFGSSDFTGNLQDIINSLAGKYGFNPTYTTMQHGLSANITIIQPIFAGGRIVNGNRLAALGAKAAALQEKIEVRDILEEVENNYWSVVSLVEKLTTLEKLQALIDTLYKDVASANAAGLATENDLLQIRLKQNELKSSKIKVQNGIRLAKMNLFNTIGQDYVPYKMISDKTNISNSSPYIDDIFLTDNLDSLKAPEYYYCPEEEALTQREEARLLEISVEAKKLEKKMITGSALPQIGIGGSYGYSDYMDNGSMNGALFASVKIPISDWGKTSKQMKRQEYYIIQAENEKAYLDSQLILELRKLWIDLNTAWEDLALSKESVETAHSGVKKVNAYYDSGLSPLSELLEAQSKLRQAADNYTDNRIAYRKALQAYTMRAKHND